MNGLPLVQIMAVLKNLNVKYLKNRLNKFVGNGDFVNAKFVTTAVTAGLLQKKAAICRAKISEALTTGKRLVLN